MKNKLFFVFFLFIAVSLIISIHRKVSVKADAPVVPTTVQKIEPITSKTPQRVADLTKIAIALERYKHRYRRYPESSNSGRGWDGIFTKYGESKENWIDGLVPEFLDALPRDPRMHTSASAQYYYKSTGANYKLIAHNADDCEAIYRSHPYLIDHKRVCWAYGFWTPRGSEW